LSLPVLSLDPANLTLQGVEAGTSPATIFVQATAAQARCPKCNEPSKRIHSHYVRKLADLPWQGQQSLQKASGAASAPEVGPQWYVNTQGQTMVVIPGPVEFRMGSPGRASDEPQHKRRIDRTFAIAATAVTVKQYQAYYKLQFGTDYKYVQKKAPSEECPVHGTDWYMGVAYCNWLSDREGIPSEDWCYETDGRGQVTKLKANYLSLAGYRLPTEAEIEYATRAGALTSRYYGETEELLGQYAWYLVNSKNRSQPVGTKKPNDFGLFDLLGNVHCWCQERFQEYPKERGDEALEDKEDILEINSNDKRVLRGGSFTNLALNVRCAERDGVFPRDFRNITVGFRLARTVTP
jgi:formylglycine-generating enzyme required for sulfatase activity